MDKKVNEVDLLKALGHPIRIDIVKRLKNKEICACEFTDYPGCSQSGISQHLKVLRDNGIIVSRKESVKVLYSIADVKIFSILDILEDITC